MPNSTTILIVEDNEPTRKLITAYVSNAGYQTIEATDGENALDIIKQDKPDLILLDLQMEPVGGLRFMKRIIGTEYNTPAILVTGDPSVDILNQANELGMAGVIKKPIDEKLLISNIERVLAKS